MEITGIVLGGIAVIDLCFRYGKLIFELCENFRNARVDIAERVISLRGSWKRIDTQLQFIQRIWKTLDDELQDIQTQSFQVLVTKLCGIASRLEKLLDREDGRVVGVRAIRYIATKQYLDEALDDLLAWQNRFDPSWFLILRISDIIIDQELKRVDMVTSTLPLTSQLRDAIKEKDDPHVFLEKGELDHTRKYDIPLTQMTCVPRLNTEKWFVVENVLCQKGADANCMAKDVRNLARKLLSVDPIPFSILQCRGVVRNYLDGSRTPSSFDFVFRIPDGQRCRPISLRSYLMGKPPYNLTARFELTRQLARSVCYVHTLGLVHKNVRPETILGFSQDTSSLGSFFLVGFEQARIEDGRTLRVGDSSRERNIYRHPARQGLHPEDSYNMQHDIYSLGVCLLEIGLWQSILNHENSAGDQTVLSTSTSSLKIADPTLAELSTTPSLLKEHLVTRAKHDLPQVMGERYMSIVVNCLTCLDNDNLEFGNQEEFQDADGIVVGARYIEKILTQLNEIVV